MTGEVACEWGLLVGPAEEPISLDDAKQHASIVANDEDGLIDAFIQMARHAAESYLNRALMAQTWQLQLSGFADVIWLPMAAPLQSVEFFTYYDTDGALQVVDPAVYEIDLVSEPARIVRACNQSWPAVQADRHRPVSITYICGYASAAAVPELIKQGMRLMVTHADANRSGESGADIARKAAEACWESAGPVFWRPPTVCR